MKELGQLFITGISGLSLTPEEAEFIQEENIGGVIIFAHNYQDPAQLAELINEIQKLRDEYPLFICEKDGDKIYVVPMVGTGLWGPVWGFVSLKSDLNTVFGATFDHKTETPGLGAEISEDSFGDQFKNDVIYTDGEVSMKILKGGGGLEDPSGIDGITGGTITSVGVEEMVIRSFQVYKPYFETIK